MVSSNHAIASLVAACLVLYCSLEPAAASPETIPGGGSSTFSEWKGLQLCGNYAVHAGTAITFAANNKVTGGAVGVSRTDFAIGGGNNFEATIATFKSSATPTSIEMGGLTFTPGSYHSATLNIAALGVVTLDGENLGTDPTFVFYTDTTLITGANIEFNLENGAQAKNVFWIVGSALTTGATATIEGSILTGTAITFGASTTVNGCVASKSAMTFGASNLVVAYSGSSVSTSSGRRL
jgi:hypothetical protein